MQGLLCMRCLIIFVIVIVIEENESVLGEIKHGDGYPRRCLLLGRRPVCSNKYSFVDQEMILVVQTDAEYLSQSSLWIKVTTLPGD